MPWVIFFTLAVIWGFSFLAIKFVVLVFPPTLGVTFRVSLSLITLVILFGILKKPLHMPRSVLWKSWAAGLILHALPFSLLFWAEQFISPGLAGIMNGTVPLWTFGFAFLFIKNYETFTFQKFLGLSVGFMGLCFIFYPKLTAGSSHTLWGFLALLGMALCYAGGNVLNRHILAKHKQVSIYSNLFHQTLAAVVFMIPLSWIIDGPTPWAQVPIYFQSPSATLGLLYLAVIASSLAWLFYFYLLKIWGALRAVAMTYLIPVVTLWADFWIFNTQPPLTDLLGIAIVFLGITLVQHRKKQPLPTPYVSSAVP